jgi:hypothetical protein
MKAEILALSKSSSNSNRNNDRCACNQSINSNSSNLLPPDLKDKKLNELERAVNGLLRKMTEVNIKV